MCGDCGRPIPERSQQFRYDDGITRCAGCAVPHRKAYWADRTARAKAATERRPSTRAIPHDPRSGDRE